MAKKKNWIKGAIKRPGAFTRKAKQNNMSTAQFARKVKSNPEDFSTLTKQQANLAQTLRKFYTGGQAYALPTSANATTANMMGLGDPTLLQNNLNSANAALTETNRRIEQQEKARQETEQQASQQNLQQQTSKFGQAIQGLKDAEVGANLIRNPQVLSKRAGRLAAEKGVNNASNLGAFGGKELAAEAGKKLVTSGKVVNPAAIGFGGAALGAVGAGVKHLSNDQDATTLNLGETTGTLMQGAGMGMGLAGALAGFAPALAIPGLGWAAAGLGALGYGAKALIDRKKAREEQAKIDVQNAAAQDLMAQNQSEAFLNNFTRTGSDLGFNTGTSMTNSYIPGQQMMYAKTGGEMIKRADGSYSPRGLWDNIRANEGSGKKPTKEMLEQERKIKAEERKTGGVKVPGGSIHNLPGGAVEFKGRKHAQGGIMIDPMTEVEGGETMDKIQMAKGKPSDYIFSEHLKLGGKSFAQRHKEILKRGGGNARIQRKLQNLAKLQESVAAKNGEKDRSPKKIMENGGDLIDDNYTPGEGVLTTMPTGQSLFGEGLYSQAGGFELQDTINRNPWFDWEGFDPSNVEDVKRFQKAYNDKVPREFEVVVDGKFGDQTASIALNPKKVEAAKEEGKDIPEKVEEAVKKDSPKDDTADTTFETPEQSKANYKPAAFASLLGLAQLPAKFKPGPKAAGIGVQSVRPEALPRINLNAERAANAAMNVGAKRQFANQAAGPASMAATLASNQNARQQDLNIGGTEARQNIGLMSQEAQMRQQASTQNASNLMAAQQFNEQSRYNKELEDYQQKILNREKVGDAISGVGRDYMAYRADERLATAADETGAYLRFLANNPGFIQQFYNQKDSEKKTQEAKTGGYIKRANKLGRKKRK